jgi:cobaltochelatase CobN
VRLANIIALKHPVSVDTYAEKTLSGAKAILVRLIGGEAYWPYGLAVLQDLARRNGIALAVLPADGRPDPRLDEISTLPVSTLRRLQTLCDQGGAVAAQAALAQLALAAGLYAGPVAGDKTVPQMGFYDPVKGVTAAPQGDRTVLVAFYRSYLTAGDTAPIDALIGSLREAGFAAYGAFAPSLKAVHRAAAGLGGLGPRSVARRPCDACRPARGGRSPFRGSCQLQIPRQAAPGAAVLAFCPPGRSGADRRRGGPGGRLDPAG